MLAQLTRLTPNETTWTRKRQVLETWQGLDDLTKHEEEIETP